MKKEKIFISGIDTDAGKTYATGFIAREAMKEGKKVATVKFVQTGCDGFSEDIAKHREIMGINLPEDKEGLTAPIIFHYPASAQLAARLDHKAINLDLIDNALAELEKDYDLILIEGAGGLMVPVTDDFLSIDYVTTRELPMILVTNGVLGSINHTLLSLEAISNRNIELKGVAYNTFFDTDSIISEDTQGFLKRYLSKHFPNAEWLNIPKL